MMAIDSKTLYKFTEAIMKNKNAKISNTGLTPEAGLSSIFKQKCKDGAKYLLESKDSEGVYVHSFPCKSDATMHTSYFPFPTPDKLNPVKSEARKMTEYVFNGLDSIHEDIKYYFFLGLIGYFLLRIFMSTKNKFNKYLSKADLSQKNYCCKIACYGILILLFGALAFLQQTFLVFILAFYLVQRVTNLIDVKNRCRRAQAPESEPRPKRMQTGPKIVRSSRQLNNSNMRVLIEN